MKAFRLIMTFPMIPPMPRHVLPWDWSSGVIVCCNWNVMHSMQISWNEHSTMGYSAVSRQEWFSSACCPTNITRLLASLGQYIYSQNEHEIAVHLYVQGVAHLHIQGQEVILKQETTYPWNEQVTLTVEVEEPTTFALRL